MSKVLLSIIVIATFLSFHFLYSDGWSFDDEWSWQKKIREKVWPSDPANRTAGWWHGPFGYFCALLAAVLSLVQIICYQ